MPMQLILQANGVKLGVRTLRSLPLWHKAISTIWTVIACGMCTWPIWYILSAGSLLPTLTA